MERLNEKQMLEQTEKMAKGTDGIILKMLDPVNKIMGANIYSVYNPEIIQGLLKTGNYELVECEHNKIQLSM